MLRIIKLLCSVALLAAFVWFGTTVNLGERTLFGHISAIGRTKESQDLVRGTADRAKPLVDNVRRRIGSSADAGAPAKVDSQPSGAPAADPKEALTDGDRNQLRQLIGAGNRDQQRRPRD